MMPLPRALAPWAEVLHLFPPDIAQGLGGLIRQLAVVIAPLRAHPQQGQEEPDGYAGLHTRGTYPHLLPSEWLLAEALPEEFERRAAMGEHLFYQPQRLAPQAARLSTALFDCGPAQLGAPRLVHLALLILLARRAQAAGATFIWGCLQDPGRGWNNAVTAHSLLSFLAARTASIVDEAHTQAWLPHLDACTDLTEVWLVGDGTLTLAHTAARQVAIRDPLLPGVHTLEVEIGPGTQGRRLQLTLPDPTLSARILRDPLQAQHTPLRQSASPLAEARSLQFLAQGRKLAIRLADGSVAIHAVPNSPRAKVGKPRVIQAAAGTTLLGLATVHKRGLLLCNQDDSGVYMEHLRQRPMVPCVTEADTVFFVPEWLALRPLWVSQQPGFPHSVFVLDDHMTLWQTPWPHEQAVCTPIARQVIATTLLHGEMTYAAHRDTEVAIVTGVNTSEPRTVVCPLATPDAGATFLAVKGRTPLAAVEITPRQWHLRYGEGELRLQVWPEADVVGVLAPMASCLDPGTPSDGTTLPSLVLLEPSRTVITVLNHRHQLALPTAAATITSVVVDPLYDQVAYSTRTGEVVVYALPRREVVLRLQGGGAA